MLESIDTLDFLISQAVPTLWGPALNKVMLGITTIANPVPLVALSVLLLGFLLYKKKWHYSLLVTMSMLSGLFIEMFLKTIVQRERPLTSIVEMTDYSFPSAHATMSTIFFLLIVFIWKDKIVNKIYRGIFIALNVICILLIGFSRVYLNAHWLSDVLVGHILGALILLIIITVMSKRADFN